MAALPTPGVGSAGKRSDVRESLVHQLAGNNRRSRIVRTIAVHDHLAARVDCTIVKAVDMHAARNPAGSRALPGGARIQNDDARLPREQRREVFCGNARHPYSHEETMALPRLDATNTAIAAIASAIA